MTAAFDVGDPTTHADDRYAGVDAGAVTHEPCGTDVRDAGHHTARTRAFARAEMKAVVQIRDLGVDDARAFQALRLAALRDCPSAFASSYKEESETPIALLARRLGPTSNRCVFGAWVESDLVAMLGLAREEMQKLAHKAFIWGVYVAPDVRRRGVGRALLERALSRAAAMTGVRQVNLGVNAANVEAIGLYKSVGFIPFGIERGFMQVDGQLHDEIHMVRNIIDA